MAYSCALEHFERLERDGRVKEYCNGSNSGGRWIFQILNSEFVDELASVVNAVLEKQTCQGPVLEVMAGDGKLTEFLRSRLAREIIATDAKDGRYNIAYPKWVEYLDALDSVRTHNPSFVIVSWEPYLSIAGLELVETGLPVAWIGNPEMCGHPGLLESDHIRMSSKYSLSRHDSFLDGAFKSDIYLFNGV